VTPRSRSLWVWPSVGVAAAALLTAGVLIGRRMEQSAGAARTQTVATVAPKAPATPSATTAALARDTVIEQLRRETATTTRRARELASANPTAAAERQPTSADDLSYRLVVLRHLAGSEALITAFRSSARRGDVDAQVGAWSRELLSTTRMLEASPVVQDPTMKRLLEDLDLVIAQIAQYTARGTNNSDDLDLIEQSINKRGVINKLRSTIPARNLPAGS
jgi:hypothetical protein